MMSKCLVFEPFSTWSELSGEASSQPPAALLTLPHTRSHTLSLPVSHQCSPFFSVAVMESPSLFPVMNTRCSATSEKAFARSRLSDFLPLQRFQGRGHFPGGHSILLCLVLVMAAAGRLHKSFT